MCTSLVVLAFAAALAALVSTDASAQQQRRISGRVTAAGSTEPLAAATVLVSGTPIGTRTNDDGRFEMLVPDADIQLVARRIGFKQATARVPRTQMEVSMSLDRDVLMLEEQVITGENTSVSRRNAANDVATVSSVEITRAPTPTIENTLAGKVAGATVSSNSGAPGGGLQVKLCNVPQVQMRPQGEDRDLSREEHRVPLRRCAGRVRRIVRRHDGEPEPRRVARLQPGGR